jgi:glycosyltransferase involved in cell wall biosynthesis
MDLCFGYWSKESYSRHQLDGIHAIDLNANSSLSGLRIVKEIRAFQHKTRFLANYKLSIYSGFYTPLAIYNHFNNPNIYYCHTPPRFIYDQRSFYITTLPVWQRPFMHVLIGYLKPRYESAVQKMDVVVANSENIRNRLRQHLGKESIVIYPPCDTEFFTWQGQGDYYLSTARLGRLKNVDRIIEAFKQMPEKKLVVLSGGTELSRLRHLAQEAHNIRFTGWVREDQLRELMGKAIATVYIPKDEDFGISPVESMAAGKPVIGVREGGLLETVLDGQTGILLDPNPDKEAIIEAVQHLTPQRALDMRPMCENRAKQFSTAKFLEKIRSLINSYSGEAFQ